MNRKLTGVIAVGLMCAGVALWAQTKTEDAGGSLSALTAEVRQLRVAVEEGTRRQAEVQALAVSLSAQQSRMLQLNARIDALRTEIAGAEQRQKQSAFFLSSAQKDAQSTDPEERQQATEMLALWKQGAEEAAAAMESLRRRESDLLTALQIEEQRWSDLINRLEQSVRK